jgi:hypothetical protein
VYGKEEEEEDEKERLRTWPACRSFFVFVVVGPDCTKQQKP